MEFLIKGIFGVLLIIIGNYSDPDLKGEFIGGGIILILATLVVDGGSYILNHKNKLKFVLHSKFLGIKGEYIRFSMSYQYRIKVKDKYLLVRNSNPSWKWYQHVGGKYKRVSESDKVLSDLRATDDLKMKTGGLKKGDLALFIPAKYGVEFLDWFNSGRDREVSHWREFYEELLGGKENQVLTNENFGYVDYKFVKSVLTPLKKAPIESGWNCWEVLQYDVLDLIPNKNQLKELEELMQKGDTEYLKWASATLINQLGFDSDSKEKKYDIGSHAKWVLNLSWSNK